MELTKEMIPYLREAFKAGSAYGSHNSYFDKPFDEDEYIESLFEEDVEEDTIPISYKMIRLSCGWSYFCDVTGYNHYAVKERGCEDNMTFDIKLSQARELGFIR